MALKAFEEHGVVPDVTDSAPAAVANVRSLQPRMDTCICIIWNIFYIFTMLLLPDVYLYCTI